MTTEQKGTDNQSAADAPVAKPVKAKAAKEKAPASSAQRSSPHPLSWINLVLMLGLFALAAYAGWLSWAQQQNTAAELAVLRDRVDQAQNNAAALSAKEAELLAQAKALNEQSAQLQEQVAHNTDRLGKLPGAERQDWLLAEAEYLLRMANQRLQLERDWDGALSMLQAADNVLTETRNPRLNPVRATLAKEMLALRTAPAIDLTGAVLRVQALQEQITQLPWIPDRLIAEQPATEAEVPAADGDETWYWQLWNSVSTSLQGMIRIRERSAPVAAPLTPDQQYYLQQNMHLMLEQAQVALLRQQADLYQHSLKRVGGWLQDYLIVDDERTRAASNALQELQQWNVAPALPDISRSLQQLQTLVEQQRRGTVAPKAVGAEDAA
ncbi:uroporphyrinogen-III C-methyltransferase [Thalassolituus alkanivorans]|uniref:uroporphyrinogen-III C-methyltransferase n=1 Tax=Thalassolituus alkanivorans TaxID=2881055 RepID=UPI001E472DA6|nr:uroporphyrinogen-III C-methyltransferase [Thalassolituus alkanivorans]MCB2387651.1 uroporphyrinogen-III C-methyltransferase [Thalassolituus alkanivorans]MCB2424947.1 uroporphyrinogen-III C-methyltransferase [Thalassolituus alkanivorans]